jgi:hypothetical protein
VGDSSVAITAGSGTTISTRTNADGEHLQVVMLGRDGDNGVLDPAALADATANPTTLGLGALLLGLAPSGGAMRWDRRRFPNVFKTFDLSSATAETTIWTPGGGRKFRLMGLVFGGGGSSKLTFRDGTGGTAILLAQNTANQGFWLDLGPLGILSGAADNVLTVTRGSATALHGTVYGTEE